MRKEKWVWMPHAGHFICGNDCRFHLTTYVGGYLVSTVGEYWPDRQVREIHAGIHNRTWFDENKHRKGDDFDTAYMKEFGFIEIGLDRKYETMVFKAKKSADGCCPFRILDGTELDFMGYQDGKSAYEGHIKMCKKWAGLGK